MCDAVATAAVTTWSRLVVIETFFKPSNSRLMRGFRGYLECGVRSVSRSRARLERGGSWKDKLS